MSNWRELFPNDPVLVLEKSEDLALRYFVRRDLLGFQDEEMGKPWELPEAAKIARRQRLGGAWDFRGKTEKEYPTVNSDLVETLKQTNVLINMYGFTQNNQAVQKAREYLFFLSNTGRGFPGNIGEAIHSILQRADLRATD